MAGRVEQAKGLAAYISACILGDQPQNPHLGLASAYMAAQLANEKGMDRSAFIAMMGHLWDVAAPRMDRLLNGPPPRA